MPAAFTYDDLKRIMQSCIYVMTAHASDRAIERDIGTKEIEEAVIGGSVIEDYPTDKYGPSCLVLGTTLNGRVLHVQVSYPPIVKIIYEPTADDWKSDWQTRIR